MQPSQRAEMIDEKVIDGHIIPNHVLFTGATNYDTPYETLAFSDNLKVTVSFTVEPDPSAGKLNRGKLIEFCAFLISFGKREKCHGKSQFSDTKRGQYRFFSISK